MVKGDIEEMSGKEVVTTNLNEFLGWDMGTHGRVTKERAEVNERVEVDEREEREEGAEEGSFQMSEWVEDE